MNPKRNPASNRKNSVIDRPIRQVSIRAVLTPVP